MLSGSTDLHALPLSWARSPRRSSLIPSTPARCSVLLSWSDTTAATCPLFPGAIERFDLDDFDLVISSSHCVAKGVKTTGRHLCYCHTPVRYAWDQMDTYFPSSTGPPRHAEGLPLETSSRMGRQHLGGRAHHYVANSNFVAGRIRSYYGRSASGGRTSSRHQLLHSVNETNPSTMTSISLWPERSHRTRGTTWRFARPTSSE